MIESNRKSWTFLLVCLLCNPTFMAMEEDEGSETNVKVGVVLDLSSWIGKVGLTSVSMALSDFYASHPHYKTRLILCIRDSQNDTLGAADAALDLINNEKVEAIIGPEFSAQANFIVYFGEKAHVPIVTFSATRPLLASHRSSYFFRVATDYVSQSKAIVELVKFIVWKEVVPIYVDDEFGEALIPYLMEAIEDADIRVLDRIPILPAASDDEIDEQLHELMKIKAGRVFIVHMSTSLGSKLFKRAKEIGTMSHRFVWIMTDGMTNLLHTIDSSDLDSMQGALGVRSYVSRTKMVDKFSERWRRNFLRDNPSIDENPVLDVFGMWAYDAAWAIALAAEKVDRSANMAASSNETSNLRNVRVNLSGQKLRDKLSTTRFSGIAGKFRLMNGQLRTSVLEIINVKDNKVNSFGLWNLRHGLVKTQISRDLNSSLRNPSLEGSKNNQTYSKILKIGVPVKGQFTEFVKVSWPKNDSNTAIVNGYCIKIFEDVVRILPFKLQYDFVPFADPSDRTMAAGSYDDLVQQVALGKYDAAAGDIAITNNRSKFVDYTLPFMKSRVLMVVPIKNDRSGWIFLRPLTWQLWITILSFFICVAFVVWLLERENNPLFQGTALDQIGTSLWYSFSTMVFAHRETTVNNLTRFVVIIWLFVVLTLTQSYTANLATLLTVENLPQTTVNLLPKNSYFGYQTGSFVGQLLLSKNFDNGHLKEYGSPEELDRLLSLGSDRGGIDAAFDESPYVMLFIANYCNKYTTRDPNFQAEGFGFVFPKESPLVSHFSRAIADVGTTNADQMKDAASFLPTLTDCLSSNSQSSSTATPSLGVKDFWGLFLIAGVALLSSSLVCFAKFVYREIRSFKPTFAWWRRRRSIFQWAQILVQTWNRRRVVAVQAG